RLRAAALALPVLVLVQIFLGGLVAGSHAGLLYNTWPTMDGALIPPHAELFAVTPWIENFVDNTTLVQLNHRLVAYLIVLAALAHAVDAWLSGAAGGVRGRAAGVAALAVAQMGLGIVTLLLAVPLWAGLAHQVLAMGVLMMATVHARLSLGARAPARAQGETPFGFEGLAGGRL
ncbi:COX15/CtaA family protein, partial [Methylobacterium gregans]